VEAGDAVLDAAQAHEGVAVLDGDAGRVGLHDERRDAALVALALRDPRHDDQQVGDDAVGGPQLHAVEDVVVPVGHGAGAEAGRVGADVGLGEQEGADVRARAARQEALLLFLRAEQFQRLRNADRLVRGEQYADRRAGGAGQRERLVVVHLGQAQPAVLGVDLHAEGAELLEPVDHLVGDPGVALDDGRVDLRLHEVAELGEELLAALGRLVGRKGVGVDEVEPEAAEEQLLGEAGLAPVLLPGGLRHLTGFPLGDGGTGGGGGGSGHEGHLAAYRAVEDRTLPISATGSLVPETGRSHQSSRVRSAEGGGTPRTCRGPDDGVASGCRPGVGPPLEK
jgi:hypothetical protein